MGIKLPKAYRTHTFSLLERALFVSTRMLGDIRSCRALIVEALAGAFIRAASASSDIWPLFLPLVRPFLWACCSWGVHNVEVHRSAELLPLVSSLILDIFLLGGGSRFLSLRTCCRRWVSSVCCCFWLIGLRTGTDNLCAEDRRSCCCAKPEQGSNQKKIIELKKTKYIYIFFIKLGFVHVKIGVGGLLCLPGLGR